MIADIVILIFSIVSIAYGVRCYFELRKWAHLIKYSRVVVAYKGKVKLNAPFEEWVLWAQHADREGSGPGPKWKGGGRVLYQLGGTSIAVLSKSFVPDTPILRIYKVVRQRFKRSQSGVNPQVQEGTWSAEDHTAK